MGDFTFISVGDPHSSQRSKELENAKVRSHTARAHHRRRTPQHRANGQRQTNTLAVRGSRRSEIVIEDDYDHSEDHPLACSIPSSENYSKCSLSVHMPDTVKSYLQMFAPNIRTFCEVSGFRQTWDAEVLRYTTTSHCFHAFSAIMQSTHDSITSRIYPANEPSPQVVRHIFIATKDLRQELEWTGVADDRCLMSILFLAILSSRFRDNSQRDVHRKALGQLIKLRGGISGIDPYLKSWLLQFEAFWGVETGQFLIDGPDNGALTEEITDLIDLKDQRRLPSGFLAAMKISTVSPRVVSLLIQTKKFLDSGTADSKAFEAIPASGILRNDPWDTVSRLSHQSKEEPTLDILLHLGLLLFNYLALTSLPVWHTMLLWTNMGRWVRMELTKGLLNCITPRRIAEERCLVWLASVAVGSWQLAPRRLSVEGQMLLTFAKRRFELLLNHSAGSTKASQFFECDKVWFDIASYNFEVDGR